jgi:hypothetical protein
MPDGSTDSVLGIDPNEHVSDAPISTGCDIVPTVPCDGSPAGGHQGCG